jgi:hypothetical protein
LPQGLKVKVKHIEVTPHSRNPIGSFAVIKLFGISRLEGPATFRLDPVTEAGEAPPIGWLHGDLKPLGVRAGPGTVELLVGPEIVKAESLKPGTHVRFRMPSVEADASVEWPNLTGAPIVDFANSGAAPFQSQAPVAALGAAPANATEQALSRLQPHAALAHRPMAPDRAVPLKPAPGMDLSVNPTAPSAYSGFRQRAEAQQLAVPPQQSPRQSSVLPLALGLVIVAAMLITFLRTTTVEGSGVTLFSALRSTVAGSKEAAIVSSKSSLVLGEILEVGSTSPAGVDASGMTQREALERANDLLDSMKTPADRSEVAFWLRNALSRSLSEPRLVWAVTQLGTAYASTEGKSKPNYDAARLLWRWAADAGDAQAACFHGRLFEQGLGVPRNPKLAGKSYARARSLGGCPGLDQATLRVKDQP